VVPFSCAVPTIDEFWHSIADASQKVTAPVVIEAPPPLTEAVNVTAAGAATVADDKTNVVVVGTAAAACATCESATASMAGKNNLKPRRCLREEER
jgi:hypothetical protein